MKTNRLFNASTSNVLATPQARSMLRLQNAASKASGAAQVVNPKATGKKIRNIVVPLDGSPFAEHTIPTALAIAEHCGANVRLVHVLVAAEELAPYGVLYYPDSAVKALKRRKHKYLAELATQISGASSAIVSSTIIDGRAVSHALEDVHGLDADLIVMATHGRSAVGRFWSGSIADSLLQRVSAPLILVRGDNGEPRYAPKSIRHVMLPLDGTEESEKVLEPLREFGISPAARHTLLRVIRLEYKHVVREYALRAEWAPSRRRWMEAMRYLYPLARSLRDRGRRVHTRIVSSDEPVGQVVLRCAEQANADLLAIAYRRRGAISRLLKPSVSKYLFRAAMCPLMFVPVKDG